MTSSEAFDLVAELRVLKQRFEDFMIKTDEYRTSLCDKMKDLKESGSDMRQFCSAKQLEKSKTFQTLAIAFTIPVIGLIFTCGILFQRIIFLEKVSYGYQDAVKALELEHGKPKVDVPR